MADVGNGIKLDRVIAKVSDMLFEVRLGTLVVVWHDGGVSSHRDLGFRYRVLPDGSREEPLATFVAASEIPSIEDIRDRLTKALPAVAD